MRQLLIRRSLTAFAATKNENTLQVETPSGMNSNQSGPKLPGEDDSWESLATNLFGIDFSKPALPNEEEISFDLHAELEKPADADHGADVPTDEDVQLASFPEEEKEESAKPEPSVPAISAKVPKATEDEGEEDDFFAGFDEEEELTVEEVDEEMEDEADELEELEDEIDELEEADEDEDEEDDEEDDSYWEALNEFEWDADEEEAKSEAPKRQARETSKPRPRRTPAPARKAGNQTGVRRGADARG